MRAPTLKPRAITLKHGSCILGIDPGRVSGFALLRLTAAGYLEVLALRSVIVDLRDEPLSSAERIMVALAELRNVAVNPFIGVEIPTLHAGGGVATIRQLRTVGLIDAMLIRIFRSMPVDVAPTAAKKALTGSGTCGVKRGDGNPEIRRAMQKARMIERASEVYNFTRQVHACGFIPNATEACADAVGIAGALFWNLTALPPAWHKIQYEAPPV